MTRDERRTSSPPSTRLPRPDLVFFDVGDTLVRPDPSWADIYLGACRPFGLELDAAALTAALAETPWEVAGPFEPSREASFEQVTQFDRAVLARLGYRELPAELFRSIEAAFAAREAWHVFPDVLPALEALAREDVRRAVISNWVWGAPELLHDLDLAGHFEALVVSSRVGYQKPQREIFEHGLELTGVARECALHVGDSYRADVLGARAAAIQPVLIDRAIADPTRAANRPPQLDVPVIRDLFELLDLIGVERPDLPSPG
ncbi:MAG: HAD family hydrolase [Chloroflexota bacterium]|nr:HAD family hydrolase [Chloroflexota bacterium]